ncbi:unnamed protein product [Bursaphelenchus okinawaensis]|uniref:C2H2-type domain-containing protein n=1 Tax=Bursaphelenchus okinawaensis TaxID=465554 RepID=A0A811L9U9_9BILA|nr:unnamed protein product [Bursaphelenchus okinawaensis]CAG9119083.1 unnamed protein product [Bursaphelenchus okinawaensis]
MESEDLSEMADFLEQESGGVLSDVAHDLINECYGATWSPEASNDFVAESDDLHCDSPSTSQDYLSRLEGPVYYQLGTVNKSYNSTFFPIAATFGTQLDINNDSQCLYVQEDNQKAVEENSNNLHMLQFTNDTSSSAFSTLSVGRTRFQCPECESHFSRRNDMNRHLQQKHGNPKDVFFCPYCLTDFTRKQNCIRHYNRCTFVPKDVSVEKLREPLTEFPG